YTILPDAGSAVIAAPNVTFTPVPAPLADELTIAGFNLERFFDNANDPSTSEPVLTDAALNNRLNKASLIFRNVLRLPDVVGVLQTLATHINTDAVTAGLPNPNYTAYLFEGNDVGGIDAGLLVKDRVSVLDVRQEGKDATYINPRTGSPELLNDRPPIVLEG